MTEYLIATSGCDDTTRAFVILTDAEAETVKTIASAINVRAGGCKPSLSISLWADASAYEREEATEPIDEG